MEPTGDFFDELPKLDSVENEVNFLSADVIFWLVRNSWHYIG